VRLKRGWPLLLLIALLIGLPILEVWILVLVADQVGIWPTLATLVIHAVGGGLLMRHEGRRAWQALTNAYTTGKVPTGHLADAALILLGGTLLMMPGYLTDVIGFLFLFRWTRPFARKMIAFFIARRNKGGPGPRRWSGPGDSYTKPLKPPGNGPPKRAGEPTIIPGEVESSPENGRPG
jgi:UPF0716 protein FxsA